MLKKDVPTYNWLLVVILLVAAILRLYQLESFSLSNDELSALARLNYDSLSDILRYGVKENDMHPAGTQVFLWGWTNVFGNSPFAVRFPFIIFGLLTVYTLYRIGKLWFDEKTGLIAAALITALSFTVLYTRIARPYSIGLFFVLLATYQWSKVLFFKGTKKNFLWLAVAFALCAYTHYFSLIHIGIMGLLGLFCTTQHNRKAYIFSGIFSGILFIPGISILLYQFKNGGGGTGGENGWLGAPENDWLADFLYYAFNQSSLLLISLGAILVLGIIKYQRNFQIQKLHLIAIVLFLLPYLFGHAYSLLKNPLLQYSVMLFSFPMLVLFVSSLFPLKKPKVIAFTTLLILLVTVYSTGIEKQFYNTLQFGDFRVLAVDAKKWNDTYGKENITHITNTHGPFYANYYADKANYRINYKDLKTKEAEDIYELIGVLEESNTTYLAYTWSSLNQLAEIREILLNYYPKVIEDNIYRVPGQDNQIGSRTTLFAKGKAMQKYSYVSKTTIQEIPTEWNINMQFIDTSIVFSDSLAVNFTGKEYGFLFSATAEEMRFETEKTIALSIMGYLPDGATDAQIVFEVKRGDEIICWYSSKFEHYIHAKGQWTKVYFAREITEEILPTDEVRAYIWNSKSLPLYVDDFEVKVVE